MRVSICQAWLVGLGYLFTIALGGCGGGGTSDDPCEGVTCSFHGSCIVEDGTAQCECAPGYAEEGLACVQETPDGDADSDADLDSDADVDGDVDADGDDAGVDAEWDAERDLDDDDDAGGDADLDGDVDHLGDADSTDPTFPSNIRDVETLPLPETDPAPLLDTETLWHVNTESGEIISSASDGPSVVYREAGTGVDDASGVGFTVRVQGAGLPRLGVFVVRNWTLPEGVTWQVNGAFAFVLYSPGTCTVSGDIDARAMGSTAGPGGWAGGLDEEAGSGPGGGGGSGRDESETLHGAGGGGHGGVGGEGSNGVWGTFSVPGPVYGADVGLVPLLGGSGGGGSIRSSRGGGGGGAVQFSCASGVVLDVLGRINTGGGGGTRGYTGGSGGSGGAVLVEGTSVHLDGNVASNGGGGGGSNDGYGPVTDGEDGAWDDTPTVGGCAPSARLCAGPGGAGTSPDGEPGYCAIAYSREYCPSAGGGAGRIHMNAASLDAIEIGGLISPHEDTGLVTRGALRFGP